MKKRFGSSPYPGGTQGGSGDSTHKLGEIAKRLSQKIPKKRISIMAWPKSVLLISDAF